MKKILGIFVLLAVMGASSVEAATASGSRANKKLVFTVGVLPEPLGGLIGLNVGYNIFSFLQARVGYSMTPETTSVNGDGSTTSGSSSALGTGVRMFVPGWNLSPFVGFGYTDVTITGSVSFGSQRISDNDFLQFPNTYLCFGFEWQFQFGLVIGLQGQYAFGEVTIPGSEPIVLPIIPGVYLGWSF